MEILVSPSDNAKFTRLKKCSPHEHGPTESHRAILLAPKALRVIRIGLREVLGTGREKVTRGSRL
ncbi:hypothetical protein PSTG_11016 [Puccinia striiformis f. sp. tritici PST-78]|uniref:Uncharacterized protein n=1 Tax=Puccinia striiformis f. sp. tritici PST-78 TaxID=1165861 RepID=A0A0L0V8Y0_9BASI|nr:hypothetical protein PSTG_11016 [Puccinia striiformis f. sp. tritici PST-78]